MMISAADISTSRWPASMLAKSRTRQRHEAQELRQHLERDQERLERLAVGVRHPGLQVPADAVLLHADVVRRGDRDERQCERDRQAGGGGVQREAGEAADLVVGVDGQRDVADQVRDPHEHEQRGDVREPAHEMGGRQRGAGDLRLGERVDDLGEHLGSPGLLLEPAAHDQPGAEHADRPRRSGGTARPC